MPTCMRPEPWKRLVETQNFPLWHHISVAPFDSDLELAVIDGNGVYAFAWRAAAFLAAGAMRRPGAGLALSLHIGASGRDCPRQCIDRQPPDGAGPKRRHVTYDYIRTSDAPDITIHTYDMFFPRANPRRIEHRPTGVTIRGERYKDPVALAA